MLQAIGAAREWIAPECRIKGMQPGLTVYVSEHTHSSAEKAAITLGFGQENVRRIAVDDEFRMRPELLAKTIEADIAEGKRPCCIVASVGSTSTTAIEDVPAIADIADRHGIWLHVDAAYAGPAAIVPEMRHILRGVERAQSLVLNPHKWLYVPMDCSVLYTRMPDILRRASSLSAEYLKTAEDERVVNFNDYGVQLGRRFRALKLWYVFRYYGHDGIIAMLRESLRLTQLLKTLVEADADFEISAPVPLSLVCFRHRSSDEVNRQLLADINASGKLFLSHTVLNGKYCTAFRHWKPSNNRAGCSPKLATDSAMRGEAGGSSDLNGGPTAGYHFVRHSAAQSRDCRVGNIWLWHRVRHDSRPRQTGRIRDQRAFARAHRGQPRSAPLAYRCRHDEFGRLTECRS